MNLSVPEHTIYFSGYLDAVGRQYTTEDYLYCLNVRLIDDASIQSELGLSIVKCSDVADMVVDFETSISKILNTDPRERVIFYLIEYFMWYRDHFEKCVVKKLILQGDNLPENHLAYKLIINDSFEVLFLCFITEKQ